jgi:predicted regulator of Ras-like GTPase activity (Roadblock/LC7/MglB family)
MGYVLFKQGKLAEAETHLSTAATNDRDDASIATALRMVRRLLRYAHVAGNGNGAPGHAELLAAQRRVEEEARLLFADILGEGEHTALLLNADGLVAAGLYVTADGEDVSQEVGAALTGVRDEALRVVRHLDLGAWKAVVYETDLAIVALAPAVDESMVLVAAGRSVPLGFVRRVLDRCVQRATAWLEEAA